MEHLAPRARSLGMVLICSAALQNPVMASSGVADLIGDYQKFCDAEHGYATFKLQLGCFKSEIATTLYKSDPDVVRYVTTANQLLADIEKGTTSSSVAREELQKTVLEIAHAEENAASRIAEVDKSR